MKHRSPRIPWSEREVALLLEMKTEGFSYEAIGAEIGRTANACEAKHVGLRIYAFRRAKEGQHNVPLALEQLAERDRRREASFRRSFTAEFFGDPPLGYSALDRKRQGRPA